MIELIHQYSSPLEGPTGRRYLAHACADQAPGGLWEGWFLFLPQDGGEALATDRETTQSKREDVVYWSTGIEPVYLEGAFRRALDRAPELRLARHIARAERAEAYARAEAETYQAATRLAREKAEEARQDRLGAERALKDRLS
jgi:hypothetical protein